MKRMTLVSIILFLFLRFCNAQYTVLLNFNFSNGAGPWGTLAYSTGVLYGTAYYGGKNYRGCIFSVDTNGNNYKDLFDFSAGNNGMYPNSPLVFSGNKLYGMTMDGGTVYGNIFSINTNGSGYKDLFNFSGLTGGYPYGSLTLSGNKLYGTTPWGGVNGNGTVFSIDTNGSGYKKLLDFNNTNGNQPVGSLILSKNKLYGTTWHGGAHNGGCIFSLDTNGGDFKDIFDYNDTNAGLGSLTLSGNLLYGMTSFGGLYDSGSIFSIDTSGTNYKDIFDFNGTNGAMSGYYGGSLTLSGNVLVGIAYAGSIHHYGCIFSININGTGYNDLIDFNETNGAHAGGSLTLLGNMFYGATYSGGTTNEGIIFGFKDASLGINNENATVGSINTYPNPSNGKFTLTLSNINSAYNVEIYNVLGEKVYSGILQQAQNNNSIDLSSQPNGVYFYRVITQTGEFVGSGKLVISR